MKPIVIEKDADGRVLITVDQIRQMVDDAYNAGYMDGRNAAPVVPTYPCTPTWTPADHITITCESLPVTLQTS